MQNPIHEAGETARSAIGVFREAPFTFGLMLICFALVGYLYFQDEKFAIERADSAKNRAAVFALLAACRPPSQRP